jgi:hypothetical protein
MRRALAVFVSLGVIGGCVSHAPPGDQGLSDRIAELTQRVPDTTLDLAALAPFHWTRLYIFEPYTTRKAAERVLGFDWQYEWGAIQARDDRVFLVFVDSGRVVAAFEQMYDRGNFAHAARGTGYPRDSATFRLDVQGTLTNGAPNVVVRWQP